MYQTPNYQKNELLYVSFGDFPDGLPMVLSTSLPDGTEIYIEDWAQELTVPPYAADLFSSIKGDLLTPQRVIDVLNAPESDELVNLIKEVLGAEKISYTPRPESFCKSAPNTELISLQVLACLEEREV